MKQYLIIDTNSYYNLRKQLLEAVFIKLLLDKNLFSLDILWVYW